MDTTPTIENNDILDEIQRKIEAASDAETESADEALGHGALLYIRF
jgi:hypothetical protein